MRPERVTVVRNGPDVAVLRQVPPHPAVPRDGRTVIGYVGSIGHHDGVDYLLRALYELRTSLGRGDFFGVLVGAGDALEDVRALAQDFGLRDGCSSPAGCPTTRWPEYLSATDLVVAPEPSNPYIDRCTVIKMMEYMALGNHRGLRSARAPCDGAGAALYAEANRPGPSPRCVVLMDAPALGRGWARRARERLCAAACLAAPGAGANRGYTCRSGERGICPYRRDGSGRRTGP